MHGESRFEAVDVRSAWDILKRKKRVVILSVAAFGALGLALDIFMPPVYEATVRLEIRRPAVRAPLTGDALDNPGFQSENVSMYTVTGRVTNRALLGQIAGEFGPQGWIRSVPSSGPDQQGIAGLFPWMRIPNAGASARSAAAASVGRTLEPALLNTQIDWLQTIIAVEPVQDTRLVNIKVDHHDPVAALAIADRLASLFVADQTRRAAESDSHGLDYMASQLAQVRNRIEASGDGRKGARLASFASLQARIGRLNQTIADLTSQSLRTRDDRVAASAQLKRLGTIVAAGQENAGQAPVESATSEALRRDLQSCEARLAAARGVYGEKHPKLLALESEHAALLSALSDEQERSFGNLRAARVVLGARERVLVTDLARAERELGEAQRQLQSYSATERDMSSDQDLYGRLLVRVEAGRIEGLMKNAPVEIVDAATLAPQPVRPRKLLNLIVCLATGLLVGTGLALLRDSMHRVIRTPREAEQQLELPVLGVIPKQS